MGQYFSSRNPPPLLGYFTGGTGLSFVPSLEAPNRVPPERFSLQIDGADHRICPLGCCHGLVLIFVQKPRNQFLVCDPVTGDRHTIVVPPGFNGVGTSNLIHGAVHHAAAGDVHFQLVVVMVDIDDEIQHRPALATVYSSQTGLWDDDLISTPLPPEVDQGWFPASVCPQPAVLVGDSFYWLLRGKSYHGILEFDFERRSLMVIQVPVDMFVEDCTCTIMRVEGGGLGFLSVSKFAGQARLWKRRTDWDDGVISWGLGTTIEMDKLLSLDSKKYMRILGYAEENNLLFIGTPIGFFMLQLQSGQVTRLFESNFLCPHHPFESVYTAEKGIGGTHDGAEILNNT